MGDGDEDGDGDLECTVPYKESEHVQGEDRVTGTMTGRGNAGSYISTW